MSYGGYVMAAYAVFLLVLAWDWLAPRFELRRQQRHAAQRVDMRAQQGDRHEASP